MDFHTLRNTAIVGLIQVGVIVAGVLAAGVYQKWGSTFNSPVRAPGATFMADYGGWLLLVPVGWTAAAAAAMRAGSDRTRWVAFASGFAVIAVLVLTVLVGVVFPWLRMFEW